MDQITFITVIQNTLMAIQHELYQAVIADKRYVLYLTGLKNTVLITLLALAIGVSIGLVIAVVKVMAENKKGNFLLGVLNVIANLYTTVIRGTPVVVQLIIINGAILVALDNKIIVAGVAFGINSGAYVAEIFRAGIQSVDKGQMEAGRSLGMPYFMTMSTIILPQAVKNILPTLVNEVIALLKETSVSGYVAIRDLTMAGNSIISRTYSITSMYVVAVIYLVLVLVLTMISKQIERRLARSDNR